MLIRIITLLLFVSCASNNPTPYQKKNKKDLGYANSKLDNFQVASFQGNSYTSKERAQSYAEFRAIEICRDSNEGIANIMDIFDKTVEKEVTRTTGTSWGPSYYGMYPYYSRYSSIGVSAGFNTISADSWSETIRFPVIEVYFTCDKKVFRPELIFKELTADEMKHLVKDVKGAIQVEKIPEGSPNANTVETGDIILKAQGERIEKVYQLINMFGPENQSVKVQLLREGKKKSTILRSQDVTREVKEAEEKIISKVCEDKDEDDQEGLKKRKLCQK